MRKKHGLDFWENEVKRRNDALQVIILTPHIRKYLEEHDPQALRQAEEATKRETEETPECQ
jgi:phosphoglycerate dehydrogenase-like enzyme